MSSGSGQRSEHRIVAVRFTYRQGMSENKFETIPFYVRTLRRFLRRHNGKAVWIKGGIVRRNAYLIFHRELAGEVLSMLLKPLEDMGFFDFEPANPKAVIMEAIREKRRTIGYLKAGELELGKPFTATIEEMLEMPYDPEELGMGYPIRLKPPIRLGDSIIYFKRAYAKKWRVARDPNIRKHPREDILITLEDVEVRSRARREYAEKKDVLSLWLSDLRRAGLSIP